MKNLLLLVILLTALPASAGVGKKLFEIIFESMDNTAASVKKSESGKISSNKKDIVDSDTKNDLINDLNFIESSKFRFSQNDFLKGRENLKNAHSLTRESDEFFDFQIYMHMFARSPEFRKWLEDFIRQSNEDLTELESNDQTLNAEQLHELISHELEEISDPDLYAGILSEYFSRLAAYGWGKFHPFRDYDESKLNKVAFISRFTVEAQSLSLMEAAGFDIVQQEEWIRKVLVGMSTSNDPFDLITYISGCVLLANNSPGAFGAMYPGTKKIVDELCTSEQLISVSQNASSSFGDSDVGYLFFESILLNGLAQSNAMSVYYPLRDKLLTKVPMLLESNDYSSLAEEILMMVAFAEIGVGNLENAYDISLLLLYEFGEDPEVRNLVLGYLLPTIFIEAEDLVMTGKLLRMVEPMADDQSDFFIAAESKINLLTVMINYARLRKEQSI